MGWNLTQKILRSHLVAGRLEPGSEIALRIDQTLTQDATGTMAFLQFEAMGLDRVRNELAVSYVDHNTVQAGFENADDHDYLRTVASRYGVVFSPAGNGICHQLHLERFAAPGKTLLGSDSHTPTCGGLGMMAIGAGGLDVAVAMGGGAFHLAAPRVTLIRLTGRLPEWVSAKDVILKVLARFGVQGNVGRIFEYAGPGVDSLEVPQRATIANMGAECGVTTSIFPSDGQTRSFLAAQGREEDWTELRADDDAAYDAEHEIDLSTLEPLAAAPHSPGRVKPVTELAGLPVQQVLIGSCTNASYRDLRTVCDLLAGRRIAPGLSLGIAPGSRAVLLQLAGEGRLTSLLSSGARLLENACGFCIGNSMSPPSGAVSLRTSNRNFEGRSGTASAQVYLVSSETAVAAALTGRITDPRTLDIPYPRFEAPGRCVVLEEDFLRPPADGKGVEVLRGPNIGAPPVGEPLPEELHGRATIKVGDDITTDHIMPAGARLKYRSNVPVYAGFVLEPVDPDFARRAAATRDGGEHNFIVAGRSYGQGSSREHAALCPMHLGVKAVLALSIERIHMANLINFGILPLLFEREEDCRATSQGDVLVLSGVRHALERGSLPCLRNLSADRTIPLRGSFSKRQRDVLLAGGLLNYTRRQAKAQ